MITGSFSHLLCSYNHLFCTFSHFIIGLSWTVQPSMCYQYSQYDIYNIILSPKVFLYVFQTYKQMKAKSFKMSYQSKSISKILSFCQVSFNGKIPTYSIFYNANSWNKGGITATWKTCDGISVVKSNFILLQFRVSHSLVPNPLAVGMQVQLINFYSFR